MSNRSKYEQIFAEIQIDVFRLAKRDHGLSVKRLALLCDIPQTTLQAWANGTTLPAWAMMSLSEHIPDDIMSMLGEQSHKFIGTLSKDGEPACVDTLGRVTAGYTAEYLDAKSDGVVTPMERAKLRDRARRVASVARAVAA